MPLERHTGNDYREALRESAPEIRDLIARKLAGEDVCSEKLGPGENQVVCTPEGVFKWADLGVKPGCRRCSGYRNSFAYQMCAEGRIPGYPRTILLDPC